MERVGVLINKLQEQLAENAGIENLLVTTQLLQSELLLNGDQYKNPGSPRVAVIIPNGYNAAVNGYARPAENIEEKPAAITIMTEPEPEPQSFYKPVSKPDPEPPSTEQPGEEPAMPVPQPEPYSALKPAPEPIPHFEEEKPWQRLFVNNEVKDTAWNIDPMMEIPTLAHQEKVVYELNDVMVAENSASLNDRLKQGSDELGSKLQDTPVKDLKKAISINDRHRFIQELFRGDETMYERSVKTINGFNIFAEAEYWIQRELKVKLGWDTTLELVKVFDQVVKRRFS